MEYLDNIQAQIRKGILEFAILVIIEGGEIYASDILKSLSNTELIIVEGTLYPLLSRLKRHELVQYAWKESKTGPPRKYYNLTPKGVEALGKLKITWSALYKSINNLMKNGKSN